MNNIAGDEKAEMELHKDEINEIERGGW